MIVHTFPPIGSVGGSIRILKFLKYINELRDDIFCSVITLRDDFVLLNDPHLSEASLEDIPKKNVKIIRTNTLQPRHPLGNKKHGPYDKDRIVQKDKKKSSLPKRLYNFIERNVLIPDYSVLWFPYSIRTALKEIRKNNIEIVYATAPPFSVLLQAAIIKKITKVKLILDVKDDWMHDRRFEGKSGLTKMIETSMERFCVRSSDKVILVTSSSQQDFIKRYPSFKSKFELISNGCDVEEYVKHWEIKRTKNIKFTIVHAGVIATTRDPSGFFRAISELKDEGLISPDNCELKFIGLLPKKATDLILNYDLQKMSNVVDILPRDQFIKTISGADLLLAFNYQIKTLIPGKLYDYWGSRRPVLLIDKTDSMATSFVSENKLGMVRDFQDIEGIKEVIKNNFNIWRTESLGPDIEIKNLYLYDRKNLTAKFIELLDKI
jgi:glycosyltransferase involved in cell wall biosynthesis